MDQQSVLRGSQPIHRHGLGPAPWARPLGPTRPRLSGLCLWLGLSVRVQWSMQVRCIDRRSLAQYTVEAAANRNRDSGDDDDHHEHCNDIGRNEGRKIGWRSVGSWSVGRCHVEEFGELREVNGTKAGQRVPSSRGRKALSAVAKLSSWVRQE